jgi:uncharacterized membrane protein YhaH (DUF805 family)
MADTMTGVARTPWQWMTLPFTKFTILKGRASRAEYWWFMLFGLIVNAATYVLDYLIDNAGLIVGKGHGGYFTVVAAVVLILPQITVSVRRLHDVGRAGWWLLVPLVLGAAAGVSAAMTDGDVGGTGMSLPALALLGASVLATLLIFVWSIMRGTPGDNRYGANPLG